MSPVFRLAVCIFCLVSVAVHVSAQAQKPVGDGVKQPPVKKANARPPSASAATVAEPFDGATVAKMAAQCVTLDTAAGVIEIEMLPESAPESVRNFLNLVAADFFDSTTFSRVVKDFIIQGGNISTREGLTLELVQRARRTVPDEPSAVKHVRGIVSMARTEEPNSATTHFFILAGDAPHLDGKFAAFGRVVRGIEAVDQINRAPIDGEKPVKPVRINSAGVASCAVNTEAPAPQEPAGGKPRRE